jgi:hypothetical protein
VGHQLVHVVAGTAEERSKASFSDSVPRATNPGTHNPKDIAGPYDAAVRRCRVISSSPVMVDGRLSEGRDLGQLAPEWRDT